MKKFALFLILSTPVFAALGVKSVWEVRPTNGLDTNGGCFDAGVTVPGTDFTQQNALQQAYTDLVAPSTTTITSVGRPFSSVDPGNCIHIASGTGWTVGWFEIISVSGSTATVDRAIATISSTGGTGSYGGALKTLTQLNTNMAIDHGAFVKAEATIAVASTIAINFSCATSVSHGCPIVGYTTTRTDGGYVTLQASANNITNIVNITAPEVVFKNFILDCNSKTATIIAMNIQGNPSIKAENILVKGSCPSGGIAINNQYHVCVRCIVVGTAGTGFALTQGNGTNTCYYCAAVGGTGVGFSMDQGTCINCISSNNTGASSDGFSIGACCWPVAILHSIAYKNGRDGIRMGAGPATNMVIENTITYGNTGWGINSAVAPNNTGLPTLNYNAFGSNTAGARQNVLTGTGDIALTADPFTNGTGSADFSLNSTAGGGTAVKALGYPAPFTVGGVTVGTGATDIGALQTVVAAGAGSSGSPIIQ